MNYPYLLLIKYYYKDKYGDEKCVKTQSIYKTGTKRLTIEDTEKIKDLVRKSESNKVTCVFIESVVPLQPY